MFVKACRVVVRWSAFLGSIWLLDGGAGLFSPAVQSGLIFFQNEPTSAEAYWRFAGLSSQVAGTPLSVDTTPDPTGPYSGGPRRFINLCSRPLTSSTEISSSPASIKTLEQGGRSGVRSRNKTSAEVLRNLSRTAYQTIPIGPTGRGTVRCECQHGCFGFAPERHNLKQSSPGAPAYRLSARASHILAKSQSRITVLCEMFITPATS